MLIRTNSIFRIEEYYTDKDEITFISNKAPDFNMLRESKTLEMVNKMAKTAKVIKIAPKESDFLYVRNRAVSAGNVIDHKNGEVELIPIDEFYKFFEKYAFKCRGANDNGDFFSHEELEKSYITFIGKSVFVDHDNDNVENARGIILDAIYNQKGKFVELLKAVDKKAYPELARGIEMGYISDTSMGCRCGYSICSICNNKMISEEDACEHVLKFKGSTFNGLPVWEDNRDIEFFEDSFVCQGADPQAKIMEKVASLRKNNFVVKQSNDQHHNSLINSIIKEKNQRSSTNRINKLSETLKNIPWT